jgi:hypothetical protein
MSAGVEPQTDGAEGGDGMLSGLRDLLRYTRDTASTGVETRGMHAEPHRLVNPMEHPLTADTQYALAA